MVLWGMAGGVGKLAWDTALLSSVPAALGILLYAQSQPLKCQHKTKQSSADMRILKCPPSLGELHQLPARRKQRKEMKGWAGGGGGQGGSRKPGCFLCGTAWAVSGHINHVGNFQRKIKFCYNIHWCLLEETSRDPLITESHFYHVAVNPLPRLPGDQDGYGGAVGGRHIIGW